MNDISATTAPQINWANLASSSLNEMTETLESLLENFGPDDLGQALSAKYLGEVINLLRTQINDTDQLPQGMKDLANIILNAHEAKLAETCPCSQEASDAVENSDVAADIENAAAADVGSAAPDAPVSPNAQAEADAEADNEGGDQTVDDVLAGVVAGAGNGDTEGKKGNWLAVLAGALADIQSQFLDKAMDAKDRMVDNGAKASDGESKAFLEAQGDYTANIQLFTIFSNQTSTSIKSIGEALAGISRKQ